MRRTLATPYLATSASRPPTIFGEALSPSIRSASVEPLSAMGSAGQCRMGRAQRNPSPPRKLAPSAMGLAALDPSCEGVPPQFLWPLPSRASSQSDKLPLAAFVPFVPLAPLAPLAPFAPF